MRKRVQAVSIFAGFATAILIGACADGTQGFATAPQRSTAESSHSLLGGLTGIVTDLLVTPVKRTTPLAAPITWSFTVGPNGAVSNNSTAGLTITVPYGALSSTQTITVTALSGSAIAYKFEPHGLVFARKVSLTQNLRGTTAGGLLSLPLLSGAYFATDELELTSGGLAKVTEIIPALGNLLARTATFPISHFSGYILASGRSASAEVDDQ